MTDPISQVAPTNSQIWEQPACSDVDVAVVDSVIQLIGNGDKLIANLPGDRAEILRDMLTDAIDERWLGLRRRIAELEERIRKVREIAEAADDQCSCHGSACWPDSVCCSNAKLVDAQSILAVLDGEDKPLATGGVVTGSYLIGESGSGCAFPPSQIPQGAAIHVPDEWKALMPLLDDNKGIERPLVDKVWNRDWDNTEDAVYDKEQQ